MNTWRRNFTDSATHSHRTVMDVFLGAVPAGFAGYDRPPQPPPPRVSRLPLPNPRPFVAAVVAAVCDVQFRAMDEENLMKAWDTQQVRHLINRAEPTTRVCVCVCVCMCVCLCLFVCLFVLGRIYFTKQRSSTKPPPLTTPGRLCDRQRQLLPIPGLDLVVGLQGLGCGVKGAPSQHTGFDSPSRAAGMAYAAELAAPFPSLPCPALPCPALPCRCSVQRRRTGRVGSAECPSSCSGKVPNRRSGPARLSPRCLLHFRDKCLLLSCSC